MVISKANCTAHHHSHHLVVGFTTRLRNRSHHRILAKVKVPFTFFAVRSLEVSATIVLGVQQRMDHHRVTDYYRHYQVEGPSQPIYLLQPVPHHDDLSSIPIDRHVKVYLPRLVSIAFTFASSTGMPRSRLRYPQLCASHPHLHLHFRCNC